MTQVAIGSPVEKIKKIRISSIDFDKLNQNHSTAAKPYAKTFYYDGRVYAVGTRGAFYTDKDYWYYISLDHKDSGAIVFAMYKLDMVTYEEWQEHERAITAKKMTQVVNRTLEQLAQNHEVHMEGFTHPDRAVEMLPYKLYSAAHKALCAVNAHLRKHLNGEL